MSQVLASLSRKFIPLVICFLISACNGSYTAFESDEDFNVDSKTTDIETENAEKIALAALQSAYLAHYHSALYDFLDASDLPADAVLLAEKNTYECALGEQGEPPGTVQYTFTRAAGEIHKPGDRISVSFDNCKQGNVLHNGKLSATYAKIKGLNNSFIGTDTQTCLANLQEELNLSDSQVIYVSGDDVKFRSVADTLEVDVIDYVFTGSGEDLVRTDKVLETKVVGKSEEVIIVNNLLELPVDAITSETGDQLYSVIDQESEKHNCQNYERTLSVSLNQFSSEKGDLKTTLHGSVTLFEAQNSTNRLNQELIDSNFTTTVEQGNLEQVYTMSNYRVQKALNLANDSYSYLFEGLVSSPALFGTVQLTSLGKLLGNLSEAHPYSGSMEIKGQGLERINLIATNLNISLQIDFNGDSNGTGFADLDVIVDTTWADLLERNFKR